MPTLSLTEKDENGNPALLDTAANFLSSNNTDFEYARNKIHHLRDNLTGGILKQIHIHVIVENRDVLLNIETNLALAPHYLLSLIYHCGHRTGIGNMFFMATHENSNCAGVPILTYSPRTSNTANSTMAGIQTVIFSQLDFIKLVIDVLTTRHLSDHDIYHMLNTLSLDTNAFAISRLGDTTARISAEVQNHTGHTTLFAVLSSIYAIGMGNTKAGRVPKKIGEIKNAVSRYLEATKTAPVRIMSKDTPLPPAFHL